MTGACVVYYRSKDGDTVDRIVWQYYGRQSGRIVEAVLAANPGLSDLGPDLPEGVRIALPEVAEESTTASARLWD